MEGSRQHGAGLPRLLAYKALNPPETLNPTRLPSIFFAQKGLIREPKPPQKGNKGTTGHPSILNPIPNVVS